MMWAEQTVGPETKKRRQFAAAKQSMEEISLTKGLLWSVGEHDRTLITQATLKNKVKGVLIKY